MFCSKHAAMSGLKTPQAPVTIIRTACALGNADL